MRDGRVATRSALMAIVALLACDDGGVAPRPIDAREVDARDGAPSCPGATHGPSQGCETVVATRADCPRAEEVCANVCGAAYDCCYCDTREMEWRTLFIDCAPCPDAQ
jgi:hypothetical protein